jgi:hypothetical protein
VQFPYWGLVVHWKMSEERIDGAIKIWLIPLDAKKTSDKRIVPDT